MRAARGSPAGHGFGPAETLPVMGPAAQSIRTPTVGPSEPSGAKSQSLAVGLTTTFRLRPGMRSPRTIAQASRYDACRHAKGGCHYRHRREIRTRGVALSRFREGQLGATELLQGWSLHLVSDGSAAPLNPAATSGGLDATPISEVRLHLCCAATAREHPAAESPNGVA